MSLDIPSIVRQANGFAEFNPMQQAAIAKDVMAKSAIIEAPTASGKTIVAELAALDAILNRGQKVVYTCPLRALAREHFADFKRKYEKNHSVSFAISTGDFDSASAYLARFDLVFSTYEKLASLLRHQAHWLSRVGLLIVDELHELDSDRGPTLEIAITQLRQMNPKLQIVGLSATVPNASDIAAWLSARLVQSAYRPVKLKKGVYWNETIHYANSNEDCPGTEPMDAVVQNTLAKKKQVLVFANTRKNAQSHAKKNMARALAASALDTDALARLANKALHALDSPTDQCRELARCIAGGSAFHHAGLVDKQREIVENGFRDGHIKVLCATPTLAAGINLPAHTVYISSLYRYTDNGMDRIRVREFEQMAGRAGRPRFDTEGRAIVPAKSETEIDELFASFLNADSEPVGSKLGIEPVLRTHLLALICQRVVFDLESMERFFSKTLYAHQFENLDQLFVLLSRIVERLAVLRFIEATPKQFAPTLLGKRVSELFLDPESAALLIQGLQSDRNLTPFSYLHLLASASEFAPALKPGKANESLVWETLQERQTELAIPLSADWMFEPRILDATFSALVLEDWLNEKSEQQLSETFQIAPGVLYAKTQSIDWLSYALAELARVLQLSRHSAPLARLRARTKYGVKEELLFLVEVKGIGRVRARRLYNANIQTVQQLKKIDIADLSRILGEKTAAKIKAHLETGRIRQRAKPDTG